MESAASPPTVGLFGFSANPPTGEGGHRGIVRWLLSAPLAELSGRVVDEVWVLPVHRHPFPEKRQMPSFEHRLAMARLAFEDLPRVRVLDVERTVAAERAQQGDDRPGTIDVLRHLTHLHPDTTFVLVLGQDAFRDLRQGKWKESRALLDRVRVVPVRRPGEPAGDGVSTYEVPGLTDVSSSELRESGDSDVLRAEVPPAVAAYIERHGLYGV